MKHILICFTAWFCLAVWGFESGALAQTPQADVTVTYQEPTTQTNDQPLTSLQKTTVYYEARDEGGQVLDQWTQDVQASKPQGGGQIAVPLSRTVTAQTKTIWVWASASNSVGESVKTAPVTKTIPAVDVIVPNAPINLNMSIMITIQQP